MFLIILGLINFNLFFFISSQMCGPKSPSDHDSCLKDSNDKNVCCFAKVSIMEKASQELKESTDICFLVPRNMTFIAPYLNQMDLGIQKDNIMIKLDCGDDKIKDRSYDRCGKDKPQSFIDCKNYSTKTDSCCYFKSPGGEATCLLNNGLSDSNSTVFGIIIACKEKYLNISHFKYVFLMSILILIM